MTERAKEIVRIYREQEREKKGEKTPRERLWEIDHPWYDLTEDDIYYSPNNDG